MTDQGPCDLNCPQRSQLGPQVPTCCRKCPVARKDFINDQNRHLWTDENGFLGPEGCMLSRDAMPPECRDYDCKQQVFYICKVEYRPLIWKDGYWTPQEGIQGVFTGEIQNIKELLWMIGQQIQARNREIYSTTPSTVPES